MKSFLGLTGYYRKFIPEFSKIAKQLNVIQKGSSMERFQKLKDALKTEPVLQYPDFTRPFILTIDARGFAVGAILSQEKIRQDKPLAYVSKTLK